MLIAHLPSGFVLSSYLLAPLRRVPVRPIWLLLAGCLGGIFPDFDMLYFYFVDNGMVHHHRYATHWPLLWLGLLSGALVGLALCRRMPAPWMLLMFSLGGLLHVLLDSLAGDIWWFAPFVDQRYSLVTVTPRYKPWWLNFILHWVFLVELLIWGWAFWRWRGRHRWLSGPVSGAA